MCRPSSESGLKEKIFGMCRANLHAYSEVSPIDFDEIASEVDLISE